MRKLLFSLIFLIGILSPVGVLAQEVDTLEQVCKETPQAVACQDRDQTFSDNDLFGPEGILTKAASLIAMLVGVASVIMIIVGGIMYITSSGDPTNVTNAKNTILYAIIGVVVAASAQLIIRFVLTQL